MRHTVTVRGSPTIRSGELSYNLPGVQDGQCVKLTQGEHFIYLVYRIAESMGNKQAQVNCHLLTLNQLDSDVNATVEQVAVNALEHLQVEVCELDWKIVSLNQIKIAKSFLEQISVVWPNANIPIYYEGPNFVVLKVLSKRVGRLNVNTTVEFIEKGQKQKAQREEEQVQECYETQLTLAKQVANIERGYINRISISRKTMQLLGIGSNFWIIDNKLEFAGMPTISDLIQTEKKREKKGKDEPEQQLSTRRLALIELDDELRKGQYSCSKQCQLLLGLAEKVGISNQQQSKPKIQTLSLDVFLNDENYKISVYRIQDDLETVLSAQQKAQVQESLANHILDNIFIKKEFFLLQSSYPYSFNGSLHVITLNHKVDRQVSSKIYRIAFVGKDNASRKEQCLKKMKNKVVLCGQGNDPLPYLHQQYELISRWMKVLRESKNKDIENGDIQQAAEKVFQIIYEQELNKVYQFLTTDKYTEKVCAICSFGSNGKSYLHEYLSRHGHRMWKVNFRDLNAPSLSFKEIDFYLQWIFANTPYSCLFIDDFDSLCAKVDEGDQLRKRERAIGKLLLRKINTYLQVYRVKLIITAKSDSVLDEQLASHITVTLKNPNRELRFKAMNKLSKKCFVQSPIKRIQEQERQYQKEECNPDGKSKIDEIVEATESLTFGVFVKHAITFTKPKNVKTTHVYDFSKIAGLKVVKSTIKSIIQKPIKYSFLFKSVPIKLPRGILLYGATGNGKSAVGAAVQDEFKMKYFSVKGSDILSKYIGGSEAAVRDIFQRALSVSPSIIFFDEFESIVPKRSSNNTGVNDRIVNQFLCYLDGVSAISGVYIIAASSRPDMIDPAVLRPGRLDAHLFLDYPQAEQREELIRMYQKSIKMEVSIEEIVQMTADFSYSDMVGLFKELRIKRSAEVLKLPEYTSDDFMNVNRQLLEETLASFKLSVDPRQQKRQKQLYLNFKNGVSPDIKAQKQIQY